MEVEVEEVRGDRKPHSQDNGQSVGLWDLPKLQGPWGTLRKKREKLREGGRKRKMLRRVRTEVRKEKQERKKENNREAK